MRFARTLRAAFGAPLHIAISPLMQTVFLEPPLAALNPKGLIFSSETGVAAFARLPDRTLAPAWCVGHRTAMAAKDAGLVTVFTSRDAADLLAHMLSVRPEAPLLHLRGEDSHGDIISHLRDAGIAADEAVVYGQRPLSLSARALRLLHGALPIVVPLFSARSAALFCAAAPQGASVHFVAFSLAVADAISHQTTGRIMVSPRPDADAMLETVISLLREPSLA